MRSMGCDGRAARTHGVAERRWRELGGFAGGGEAVGCELEQGCQVLSSNGSFRGLLWAKRPIITASRPHRGTRCKRVVA